jgi:hypothetical protein
MLSIGKISLGQHRYYEQQVAAGGDDYYSGRAANTITATANRPAGGVTDRFSGRGHATCDITQKSLVSPLLGANHAASIQK